MDEYQVEAVPVGGRSRSLGAGAPTTTREFKLTITGLDNGQEYRFTVRAVSRRGSAESSVNATPRAPAPPTPPVTLCSRLLPPSAPTDLKVSNIKATSLQLCFGPPANYGCADEVRWGGWVGGWVGGIHGLAMPASCSLPASSTPLPPPLP